MAKLTVMATWFAQSNLAPRYKSQHDLEQSKTLKSYRRIFERWLHGEKNIISPVLRVAVFAICAVFATKVLDGSVDCASCI